MILIISVLFTAVVVNCQEIIPSNYRNYGVNPYNYNYDETPKPYAFSYNAPLEDGVGHSSRTETADGTGRVEGSYTVTNDEGHTRIVDYVADQGGFRASIRTNEPGTDNKNPADVVIDSTAAFTNYQYVPRVRRPYVTPAVNPVVAPVVVPVVAPVAPEVVSENAVVQPVPVQPAYYNAPRYYANRNYHQPRARYPHVRESADLSAYGTIETFDENLKHDNTFSMMPTT